jgi:hypothetical protein
MERHLLLFPLLHASLLVFPEPTRVRPSQMLM